MTKKRAPSPIRHLLRFCSKLIIFLSVLLCLFAFLRLHFQPKLQQLFSTSRTYRRHHHFEGPPKIAFLFLVRRNLPLDFLWGAFFKVSTYFLKIKWEAIKTKTKQKKKIWIWKSIKFKKKKIRRNYVMGCDYNCQKHVKPIWKYLRVSEKSLSCK